MRRALLISLFCSTLFAASADAQEAQLANPDFKPELAKQLGADKIGMRHYVMVILKTGPNKIPAGKERDAMFAGHFANMKRLAAEGKLMVAGPADGVDGWRGLFFFAVDNIDAARELTATDPVIQQGEMIAEYHKVYLSAALMQVPQIHKQISAKN